MRKHEKKSRNISKNKYIKKSETDAFNIQIKINEVWFLEMLEQICRNKFQIEQNEKK